MTQIAGAIAVEWHTDSGSYLVQLMANLPEAEVRELASHLELVGPHDPQLERFDLTIPRTDRPALQVDEPEPLSSDERTRAMPVPMQLRLSARSPESRGSPMEPGAPPSSRYSRAQRPAATRGQDLHQVADVCSGRLSADQYCLLSVHSDTLVT